MAARTSVSHPGLPDRPRAHAAPVDRPDATRQDAPPVLPVVRPGANAGAAVHLQRHVAAVPHGGRQEGGPRPPRARPVPHRAQHEYGDRHRPARGGPRAEAAGPAGVADQDALAVAAAPRQPDRDGSGPPPGPRPPQPEGGAQHVAARRLRLVLALSVGPLGGSVLGPVCNPGDAVAHRPDEEGRALTAYTPRLVGELVHGPRADFDGGGRGVEHQISELRRLPPSAIR